jgi:ABC transporter transmembrane region
MPVPTTVRPRRSDPRLLRRTRGSRLALAFDAALGIVAALLVLAQAVLIAHVAARSFDGAAPGALVVPLAALCVVVVARAAATWGFDVVGRLAAADVLCALRGDLVRSRLSDTPAGLDAKDDAELAVAAVAGIDALETVFARLLPQMVLAAVVPAAVLLLVAAIDPLSALLMLVTLPLVPVFMWLIGRTTERRALARWQQLQPGHEPELRRLALFVARRRAGGQVGQRAVGVGLEPARLDVAGGWRCLQGVLHRGPATALAQGVQAAVRRDPVEPGAQRRALLEAAEPAPGGEQRLLDQVLGVVQRAEQAVAVQLELVPVRLDQRRECALVACLCPFDRHRS